jgi:hypothetical protein
MQELRRKMKKGTILFSALFSIFFLMGVLSPAFSRLGWVFVMPTSQGNSFRAIDMVSHTEGWAVGTDTKTYYYNGLDWEEKEGLGKVLYCITMLSSTEGWIGGDRGFWRWNGLHWSSVTPVGVPFSNFFITSIAMLNPSYGWAVGVQQSTEYKSEKGVVFRWNGFVWDFFGTILYEGYPLESSLDVSVLSEDNAWAVGWNGKAFNWNGTSWNEVFTPTSARLRSVYMLSADDGWAVGEYAGKGVSIHWNGTQWTPIVVPSNSESLRSVFMVASNDVWAVDFEAHAIIHWDGTNWTINTQTIYELYDVDFLDASDGWVSSYRDFGHWTEIDETPPEIANIVQYPLPYNVRDGETVRINVTVTDESGVKSVLLSCIRSDSSVWSNTSMNEIGTNLYSGTIAGCPKGTTVTYLIEAQDDLGNSISTTALGYTLTYTVIPEFASITLVLLFMAVVSLVVIGYRKKLG